MSFGPKVKYIASDGYDGTVRVWNPETGKELREFRGHESGVESVRFSRDGLRLVSAGGNTVRLWDIESGEELGKTDSFKEHIRFTGFNPDERRIYYVAIEGNIGVWDFVSHRQTWLSEKGEQYIGFTADLSPDGKYVALSNMDGIVILFRSETGKEVELFEDAGRGVSFSPDGQFLATSGQDRVNLWSLHDKKLLKQFK